MGIIFFGLRVQHTFARVDKHFDIQLEVHIWLLRFHMGHRTCGSHMTATPFSVQPVKGSSRISLGHSSHIIQLCHTIGNKLTLPVVYYKVRHPDSHFEAKHWRNPHHHLDWANWHCPLNIVCTQMRIREKWTQHDPKIPLMQTNLLTITN